MSGIFSKPKVPETPLPTPPSAPIENALFEAGKNRTDEQKAKARLGKKRLQIPTSTATAATGVNTGA